MEHICKDKSYLVAGMGKSGVSSTNLLSHFGAKVVLYDDNESVDLEAVMSRLNKTAQVEFYCKYIPEHELEKIEEVVLSPGIPTDAVYVDEWRNYGWSILGEIELAYRYEQGDIIAITGTNGKTTTTALVGEIMREQWEQVFVAGNIGMPYTETVTKTTPKSCTVLEVSSFQLETIQKFHPKVSAVLNITPDHLNRHHTMEKYAKAKLDVTMNQGSDDYVILNYEDDILREASKKMEPKVIFFSSKHELEEGVFLRNKDEIIVKLGGKEISFCKTSELLLLGIHSYENVMAAIAMTWMMGVEPSKIYHAITDRKSVV